MRIVCKKWKQAIKYFSDPDVLAQLTELGISIEKIRPKQKAIYLTFADTDQFERAFVELCQAQYGSPNLHPLTARKIP